MGWLVLALEMLLYAGIVVLALAAWTWINENGE